MATAIPVIRRPAELGRKLRKFQAVFRDFCIGTFILRLQSGREVSLRVSYSEAERALHEAALQLISEATHGRVDLEIIEIPSHDSTSQIFRWRFRPSSNYRVA